MFCQTVLVFMHEYRLGLKKKKKKEQLFPVYQTCFTHDIEEMASHNVIGHFFKTNIILN